MRSATKAINGRKTNIHRAENCFNFVENIFSSALLPPGFPSTVPLFLFCINSPVIQALAIPASNSIFPPATRRHWDEIFMVLMTSKLAQAVEMEMFELEYQCIRKWMECEKYKEGNLV